MMEKKEVDRTGKNNVEKRSIKLTYIFILLVYSQNFYTRTHRWIDQGEMGRGKRDYERREKE